MCLSHDNSCTARCGVAIEPRCLATQVRRLSSTSALPLPQLRPSHRHFRLPHCLPVLCPSPPSRPAPHLLELVGVVAQEGQEEAAQAVRVARHEAGDAVVLRDGADRQTGPEFGPTQPLQIWQHRRTDATWWTHSSLTVTSHAARGPGHSLIRTLRSNLFPSILLYDICDYNLLITHT